MSRREYRRRASLGKCHRGGRCRWVRGVPADRPASVASLSALLVVSRPQTSQATPPTREQRLRCGVRPGLPSMRARLYAARFVSAPAQPRGRGPPYPAPELFCICRSAGQPRSCPRLVPCAGLWVWSPSRPPPSAVRRRPGRRTPDVRSASGRCADSDFNFPVHAPNRTQHAPSISYRCRSRRSRSAASGTRRAYPAVLRAGNPIHSGAVPGTIRGRAGCLTNDQYGADTTADCMADVAVSARRSLGNKLELCLERVAHLRLELRVRRER